MSFCVLNLFIYYIPVSTEIRLRVSILSGGKKEETTIERKRFFFLQRKLRTLQYKVTT